MKRNQDEVECLEDSWMLDERSREKRYHVRKRRENAQEVWGLPRCLLLFWCCGRKSARAFDQPVSIGVMDYISGQLT